MKLISSVTSCPCMCIPRAIARGADSEKLLGAASTRSRSFLSGLTATCRASGSCTRMGLPRQCGVRGSTPALALQRCLRCARSRRGRSASGSFLSLGTIAFGLHLCFVGGRALRWRQFHSGSPCLRQPDCNRLFRRTSPVFTLADMLDFFANEFSSLRGRRLAFARVFSSTFNCFLVGHSILLAIRPARRIPENGVTLCHPTSLITKEK
jgi:hypothetical protein